MTTAYSANTATRTLISAVLTLVFSGTMLIGAIGPAMTPATPAASTASTSSVA